MRLLIVLTASINLACGFWHLIERPMVDSVEFGFLYIAVALMVYSLLLRSET